MAAEAPQTGDPARITRVIDGKELLFDEEGFLWDPAQWDENLALHLARESGLDALDETHWQVIRFLRSFYAEYGKSPLNRQLRKGTGMNLMALEALFPGGIKNGARRIAGLPNPTTCM